jgi:20S proteasome subunit beta 4
MSAADCIFGFTGDGFAVVAADSQFTFSVLNQRHDLDKLLELDHHHLMARPLPSQRRFPPTSVSCAHLVPLPPTQGITGDMGDSIHFGEFIRANLHLYRYRNGRSLDTHAISNFTRSELANALRRGPFLCNMLIAGFDHDSNSPSLFWLDYLAMLHRVNAAGHGYGSLFIKSILDKEWFEDMSEPDALSLVRKCIREINTRFIAAPSCYIVKIVDRNGTRTAATIQSADVDTSS